MNRASVGLTLLAAAAFAVSARAAEETDKPLPTIEAFTAELRGIPGLLDLWWNARTGTLWLRVDALDEPLLYLTSLAAGVGSNDLGLDRGMLGSTRLVEFRRVGHRVLLVEPNVMYRAVSDHPGEQRAVREAFAESVIAGFSIGAMSDSSVLVDITPLIVGDALDIPARLKSLSQGEYKLDTDRSGVLAGSLKGFPRNTVVESLITFTGKEPGDAISSVVPTPEHVTVRQRHNFVALPETPMATRPFHPRSGFFFTAYRDYAAPLGADMDQRLVVRHRIEPGDELVYHVDAGAPEPIRSALMEGASWWAEAFAAAGFPKAFRVEVLPADVDPLDIRYNVIQWVHRSTRGWSYGSSVVDPRTGEILKGHVTLGSLRVRQDMLIAEGLTAPFENGAKSDSAVEAMALARLRQLSAHEVGHTLGLAHNYAASARDDASVMDYPHPMVRLDGQGRVTLVDAYAVGIGEWDNLAIRYGYTAYDDAGSESAGLASVLDEAVDRDLRFVTDQDARRPSSGHALAHLWDNGPDAVARLTELMDLRASALGRFSDAVIRKGRPLSSLENLLVPVYLLHRYQTEAAAHVIGGLDYGYPMRGDGSPRVALVDDGRQRDALDAVLSTLSVEALELPATLAESIPPPAFGYPRDRESFVHATGADFDSLAPARAAAQLSVGLLLEPARLARLLEQHGRDDERLGASDVIDAVVRAGWSDRKRDGAHAEQIRNVVAWTVANELMRLVADEQTVPQVRALAWSKLTALAASLPDKPRAESLQRAFDAYARSYIEWFLEDPSQRAPAPAVIIPPGSPI